MRALLLGLLVACTGDQGPADTDPTGSEPALDPVASPSLWVPSVLQVTWAAPASGASWVQWGTDPETLDQQTPTSAAQSVERSLLGLPAREAVHWQAVT